MVAVFWKDAACVAPWRDDDGRGTLASCITVGMITESTDTHISVAQSFGESNSYASVMSIPRSTVISVRRFGRVGLK